MAASTAARSASSGSSSSEGCQSRATISVSMSPAAKGGWRISQRWNGIVVLTPSTPYSLKARSIRSSARGRSSAQTISFASSES